MKHINLQSVIEAYRNLESSLFQKLMNSYGIIVGGLNGIKDYELDGIEGLINNIFLSSTYKCNFLGADNKQ